MQSEVSAHGKIQQFQDTTTRSVDDIDGKQLDTKASVDRQ